MLPTCSAMTIPNASDTRITGTIETLAMNHDTRTNSSNGTGRFNIVWNASNVRENMRPV